MSGSNWTDTIGGLIGGGGGNPPPVSEIVKTLNVPTNTAEAIRKAAGG